jgi:hypothetical protein
VEADWSVEIGADLPRIVVPWFDDQADFRDPGREQRSSPDEDAPAGLHFVDLRQNPSALNQLSEPRRYPGLARALVAFNRSSSPVFSSKCDGFPIPREEIDPLEFDAGLECVCGLNAYVDLVIRDFAIFASFPAHEAWLRQVVARLRKHAQGRSARVDLVLRPATVFDREGFAFTLYIAAVGVDFSTAERAWEAALDAVLAALGIPPEPAPKVESQLN